MKWDSPREWSAATWLHWILRVGMLLMLVGHGAFGIIGKEGWLPYYHVFGVSDSLAWDTMPIIGAIDIALGIVTLIRPMRAVLVYVIFWTTMTALLRPLAGQGLWQEVFERGGNFGLPIAMLLLVGLGTRSLRSWFEFARPRELTVDLATALSWALRICVALLLIGHGGFGITHLHDPQWVGYFGALGIGEGTVAAANLIVLVGLFEVALGIAVLIRPVPALVLFILLWKLGTEMLRPIAGEPVWEFVERAGDFALPIALLVVQGWLARREHAEAEPEVRVPTPVPAAWRVPERVPVMATVAATAAPALRTLNGNGSTSHGDAVPEPARTVNGTKSRDEELVRAAAAMVARLEASSGRTARR